MTPKSRPPKSRDEGASHKANGPKATYSKRREQVRQAQRKHRDKNEKYIQSLEEEVHRLYNLITATDALREVHRDNLILRDIIAEHAISLPQALSTPKSYLAKVTVTGDHGSLQSLRVEMPSQYLPFYSSPHENVNMRTITQPSKMGQQGPSSISSPPHWSSPGPTNYLDKSKWNGVGKSIEAEKEFSELSDQECFQMGVDFVLSLERPCLLHTQSAQPSGHALSMQGTLLQYAPSTLATDTRWEVSAEVFQKLFEMADRLDLDGYITPVQAWNRIRDHDKFPRLTREKLKTLENAMRPNIKCQGFAAIMEEAIFEILLNQALGD